MPFSIPRIRFSLAKLLAAITIVALLAAAWQLFFYRHPTYSLGLYEKAPSTRSGSIEVGPNRIEIEYIARNDRDVSIHYEDGFSSPVTSQSADEAQFKQVGPWLDVVEFVLAPSPGEIDLVEFRIFNHDTRDPLNQTDGYGWRLKSPNVVQVYGIGKKLPPQVDLWFRLHSREAGTATHRLEPKRGATCQLPETVVTLDDIRAGSWKSVDNKLEQPADLRSANTTLAISWSEPTTSATYDLIAVSKRGQRARSDDYLATQITPNRPLFSTESLFMPLDQIDHLELTPHVDRSVFFFDGLTLPSASETPFAPPPVAVVRVDGQPTTQEVQDFLPIEMNVALLDGEWNHNVTSNGDLGWAIPNPDGPRDVGSALTLTYQTQGINLRPQFEYLDSDTNQPIPYADLHHSSSGSSGGNNFAAGDETLRIPLKRIKEVTITVKP